MEDLSMTKNIIEKQNEYFHSGATRSVEFRIEQLKKLKNIIQKHEGNIFRALAADLGKSEFECYASEISIVYEEINIHLQSLQKWMKPEKRPTPMALFPGKSYIYRDPLGIVLIIGPFNYPLQLLFAPLVGAIGGGNCAILKGSERTPNISKLMQEMINTTFESEYIYAVDPMGSRTFMQGLLALRFDHIFFTGSTSVGKIIMQEAAKTLTSVTLELGGKSPCIVDKDAKLRMAARRIVWGKFLNAGQTCVAPDYVYVHRDIYHDFLSHLKEEIHQQFGVEVQQSPDYARLVNLESLERMKKYLPDGQVFAGGDYNEQERYFAPTILTDVSLESSVMQEEIFGPILPVLVFEDLDKVLTDLQHQEIPLALYYFSQNQNKIESVLLRTRSGGVTINDTLQQVISCHVPFGGVGHSGLGAYHGEASFQAFTHARAVIKKSTLMEVMTRFAPYKNKLKTLRKLIK